MLKKDADRDLRDIRRRIDHQVRWIEQLNAAGQATNLAQYELAELRAALHHIEHHRAVLQFSLGCARSKGSYEGETSHG